MTMKQEIQGQKGIINREIQKYIRTQETRNLKIIVDRVF